MKIKVCARCGEPWDYHWPAPCPKCGCAYSDYKTINKARDIIPGWPRGRSTIATFDNDRFRWWGFYSIYPHRNSEEFAEQMQMEILYHQMQQAMVNEWFASYRLPENYPVRKLIIRKEMFIL